MFVRHLDVSDGSSRFSLLVRVELIIGSETSGLWVLSAMERCHGTSGCNPWLSRLASRPRRARNRPSHSGRRERGVTRSTSTMDARASRLSAALFGAASFEAAARLTLRALLELAAARLDASEWAGKGRLLRGIVHFRPADGYRRLLAVDAQPGERAISGARARAAMGGTGRAGTRRTALSPSRRAPRHATALERSWRRGSTAASGRERKLPARHVSCPRRSLGATAAAITTASLGELRVWRDGARQWGCNPGRFDDDDGHAPQAPRAAGRCDRAVSG
jgi:hypothetical protein